MRPRYHLGVRNHRSELIVREHLSVFIFPCNFLFSMSPDKILNIWCSHVESIWEFFAMFTSGSLAMTCVCHASYVCSPVKDLQTEYSLWYLFWNTKSEINLGAVYECFGEYICCWNYCHSYAYAIHHAAIFSVSIVTIKYMCRVSRGPFQCEKPITSDTCWLFTNRGTTNMTLWYDLC